MTIYVNPKLHTQGLEWLRDNATREMFCVGGPASYAEATELPGAGKMVADVSVSAGNWTIEEGVPDGQQISMVTKTGVAVDASATADHLAVVNDTDDELMLVMPLAAGVEMEDGGPTTSILGWTYRRRAPTAS